MRHEKKTCAKNYNRRSCSTCAHLEVEWETFYNPSHGGDPGSTDYDYKVSYCAIDYVESDDMPMSNCPAWELKIDSCEELATLAGPT